MDGKEVGSRHSPRWHMLRSRPN